MAQLKLEPRNGELTTVEEQPDQLPGDISALKAAAEAVLFTMGDSVDIETLARVLKLKTQDAQTVIDRLMEDYETGERGIRVIRLENRYQLATKKELYPVLVRMVRQPQRINLTDVVLETLSIIAYKQPVTRVEIEKIRGVKCDHAINRLIEFGLIQEVGRLDVPGRPILFGTTEEFLRHFGTDSLDELPRINPVKVEDFKAEAEEEAKLKLEV